MWSDFAPIIWQNNTHTQHIYVHMKLTIDLNVGNNLFFSGFFKFFSSFHILIVVVEKKITYGSTTKYHFWTIIHLARRVKKKVQWKSLPLIFSLVFVLVHPRFSSVFFQLDIIIIIVKCEKSLGTFDDDDGSCFFLVSYIFKD